MILIISSRYDESTNIVCTHLNNSRVLFCRINTEDDVEIELLAISKFGQEIVLKMTNGIIEMKNVSVVWYRNGFLFKNFLKAAIDRYKNSKAIHKYHADEIDYINQYIFTIIDSKTILGSYNKGELNKLYVLKCAADIGLDIPETIVTTNLNRLTGFCSEVHPVVIKPIKDCISVKIGNSVYTPYTRVFKAKEIRQDSFFPLCLQQFIKPMYELRICFIEQQFFSVAIISKNGNNSRVQDWRYNYKKGLTRFIRYNLPQTIKDLLLLLIEKVGSPGSGSIDMIIDEDWNYNFLEINPVGQFRFISHLYDDVIEKLIAEKIILYEKN